MRTSSQSGAVSRKLIIGISIPVVLVCVVVGWWSFTRHKYQRARAVWKTTTLETTCRTVFYERGHRGRVGDAEGGRGAGDRQAVDW